MPGRSWLRSSGCCQAARRLSALSGCGEMLHEGRGGRQEMLLPQSWIRNRHSGGLQLHAHFFFPREDSGCTVLGQPSRCRKPRQGFTVVLKHLKRGEKKSYCRQKSPLPAPTSLQLNFTWLWSSPAKASSGRHESPRAEAREVRLHCTNPPRSAPRRARPALMLQSHFSHRLKSKFRKGREKAAPAAAPCSRPKLRPSSSSCVPAGRGWWVLWDTD